MDRLIQSNWGIFQRSIVVNAAIDELIHSAAREDLEMCRKRKVNFAIGRRKIAKLDELAKLYGVNRSDLIRFAIRRFSQRFAGEIVELPAHQSDYNLKPSSKAIGRRLRRLLDVVYI